MNFKEVDEWCAKTQDRRDYLTAYGKTGKPSNAEEQTLDSFACIGLEHEAAHFVAQGEEFLEKYEAQAMFETRKEYPELNSRERELVEKEKTAPIRLLVEGCRITRRSITSRYFAKRG